MEAVLFLGVRTHSRSEECITAMKKEGNGANLGGAGKTVFGRGGMNCKGRRNFDTDVIIGKGGALMLWRLCG